MARNEDAYYKAVVRIKANLGIAKEISEKLRATSDDRLKMFKTTCFGRWLDIPTAIGDPLLIHLMLQTQIYTEPSPTDEMLFRVGGYELRFGPSEFCLITGFRFGPLPLLTSSSSFRARLFPRIPSQYLVKLSNLLHIFRSKEFVRLSDVDAVRICLLILLKVGFMGRSNGHVRISDQLLHLVDDLASWDRYPWGSYIWPDTYNILSRALQKCGCHKDIRTKTVVKYPLMGFVYAFKIWIFETFPIARAFVGRDRDVIPRAIAWSRTHKLSLSWDMCMLFLTDGDQPQMEMKPTQDEQSADWWVDSRRFFDGVVADLSPPCKKSRREPSPALTEADEDDVSQQKSTESHDTTVPSTSSVQPDSDTVLDPSDFGNVLPHPFFMFFYYGGNIQHENGEIKRDASTSTLMIPARRKMRYQEFVDLIYQAIGVKKECFKLKLTLHFEHRGKSNSALITSDGTLDSMFLLAEKDKDFEAHVHVEMLKIGQRK